MRHRAFETTLILVLALAAIGGCAPDPIEELASSAVRIEARPCGKSGVGSGVVVGEGLVITNAHIVAGSVDDVTVRTGDDLVYPGVVVGFDSERDLALIRVPDLDAVAVELGEPSEGMEGTILARPGGVGLEALATEVVRQLTATGDDIYGEGDVSRRALELAVDVKPGVSGAGVFDDDGRLIGVVFAESRRRDRTTYAVDVSEVSAFMGEVDAGSRADTLRCR